MTFSPSLAPHQPPARPPGLSPGELLQLYRAHTQRLNARARRLLGSDTQRQDAVQDVYLSLLLRGSAIATARSPAAWLCVLARHCCLDLLRRRQRSQRLARELASEPAWALGNVQERSVEERDLVAALLTRLAPRQRQVAELLARGLSRAEVAVELGCSRQAVHQRVLAIRQLACELSEAPCE